VPLLDEWAVRKLKIVTKQIDERSPYIRRLVDHLLAGTPRLPPQQS
jgi:hypothetical protein